jgi:hypothetical protein
LGISLLPHIEGFIKNWSTVAANRRKLTPQRTSIAMTSRLVKVATWFVEVTRNFVASTRESVTVIRTLDAMV